MKRRGAAALLAWAACAFAQGPVPQAQQLAVRQSVLLDQPGAVAAFAVDPTIVDVSLEAGRLLLQGQRPGDTVVTVVLANGVAGIRVHVEPAPRAFDPGTAEGAGATLLETRYDSGLHRFTGFVSGGGRVADAQVHVSAEVSQQMQPQPDQSRTALRAASVEIKQDTRSVVLLDRYVQASPLTLDGVTLRGIHLKQGGLEIHGGIATWFPLRGFLGQGGLRAATASYAFDANGIRVTPHVAWFPDSPSRAKAIAAVTLEFGAIEGALRVRADAGVSRGVAGSIEVDWSTRERQVSLRGAVRPEAFASLRSSSGAASHAEGSWTEQLSAATTATVNASVNRLSLGATQAQSSTSRIDLRQQISNSWSGTVSAGRGQTSSSRTGSLQRTTVDAGLAWDQATFGVSANLRRQTTSASPSGGHGARLVLRGAGAGLRASGFVDAQQQAPTLELLHGDGTELARTLAGLGLTAAQPEDVLAALRNNAGLLSAPELGLGRVRLNPLRVQAGLDLSWRGDSPARPEFGVRMLRTHAQGVIGVQTSSAISAYANWRIRDRTDLSVTLSRWALGQGARQTADRSVQLTLRTYFDQPLVAISSGRPLTGQVFKLDTQAQDGVGERAPFTGIEIVLDRRRRTRTDAQGRYVFESPGPGTHSVEAVLPVDGNAYFMTPSMVSRLAGESADFAVAVSGVRVTGMVRNDAGLPLAGVTVRADGASSMTTVSDGNGAWRMTVAPGELRVALVPETLPPGHDLRGFSEHSRTLGARDHASIDFTVRALRSVEGVVVGLRGAPATVTVVETGRSVSTDADGRFIVRQLPAGAVTLRVEHAGSQLMPLTVTLPDGPAMLKGVRLQAP